MAMPKVDDICGKHGFVEAATVVSMGISPHCCRLGVWLYQ